MNTQNVDKSLCNYFIVHELYTRYIYNSFITFVQIYKIHREFYNFNLKLKFIKFIVWICKTWNTCPQW